MLWMISTKLVQRNGKGFIIIIYGCMYHFRIILRTHCLLAVFIKSKKMQYIVDFMGWSLHWRDKTAICAIYRDKWCTNYLKIAYAFLCNCHKTICITKTQRTYKLFSKKYCSIFYRWTLDFPFPFMFNLCTLTGQALNFMFSSASAALDIQCLTQSASSGYGEPKHLWV